MSRALGEAELILEYAVSSHPSNVSDASTSKVSVESYARHVTSRGNRKRSLPFEESMSLMPFNFGIELNQTESVGLEGWRERV